MNAQSTTSNKGKIRPKQYHRRKPVTLTRAGAVITPVIDQVIPEDLRPVKWTAFVHTTGDKEDRPEEYGQLDGTMYASADVNSDQLQHQARQAYLSALEQRVSSDTMHALEDSLNDRVQAIDVNLDEEAEVIVHH